MSMKYSKNITGERERERERERDWVVVEVGVGGGVKRRKFYFSMTLERANFRILPRIFSRMKTLDN